MPPSITTTNCFVVSLKSPYLKAIASPPFEPVPTGMWRKVSGTFVFLKLNEEKEKLEVIRNSINRGKPYGSNNWTNKILKKFGLETTERKRGRPQKGSWSRRCRRCQEPLFFKVKC